eukprot:TRINITY_DN42264_c0_g1_i1.p1 TRINITY_DN42264_c0_g1~~TRINITY_DN42264_c0_g1_i1.p1  ORF type:complete len:275 (+),score=23.74 TRINITY_DN42264_c0_g1_i1:99-827(+)
MAAINEHFPGAVEEVEFLDKIAENLYNAGFKRDNSIALVSTCRDEASRFFDSLVDRHFGLTFSLNGLAGVPPGGVLAVKAGTSHSPQGADGRERYVFFGLTHVGVNDDGTVGKMRRCGREKPSGACGALLALTSQFGSSKELPAASEDDLELHLLTKKLLEKDPSPDLVSVTKAAVGVINDTLDALIAKAVDTSKADYAVITGVQIHSNNKPEGHPFHLDHTVEYVQPSLSYAVVKGVRQEL